MATRFLGDENGLLSAALRLDVGKRQGVQARDLRVDVLFTHMGEGDIHCPYGDWRKHHR